MCKYCGPLVLLHIPSCHEGVNSSTDTCLHSFSLGTMRVPNVVAACRNYILVFIVYSNSVVFRDTSCGSFVGCTLQRKVIYR